MIPLAAALGGPANSSTGRAAAGRWRLTAIGIGLCLAVVLACFPAFLAQPSAALGYDQETGIVTFYGRDRSGSSEFLNGQGFAKLAGWLPRYEPVLAVLAPIAAVAILRSGTRRRKWLTTAVYPILFTAIYGCYELIYPRYLVSLIPFLALAAGYLAERLLAAARAARGGWNGRAASAAVGLALFAPPLAQAVRLDLLLARDDIRLLAESWIEEHLPRAGRLGVEPHGVTPKADRTSLERMAHEHPEQLGVKDRRLLRIGDDGDGRGLSRLWYLPDYRQRRMEELAALEELRYVAAVVPGDRPREDAFYRTLRARATRLAVFSPLAPGRRAADTRLPTELDNPLTGLWRVERCGPIVEIWELAR